ncbi:biopolymer transport protein ExbB [Desulfobaculum xiamenense]|uniref:Biopolymer transport protein ExbB n=1 Tax=Desulfobaculum xiamenense TaxID=995050 RepID=A0A846QCN2_9BACT|nr:MotA/TolQ/ExbB proton channel family protein [Desulfobaculum xiamenense]NJB66476.1 biopolymer transport protein ExbB [Desulfobaculum xiamenense]
MMNILAQGGIMIWPIMALSVPALAIIAERFVAFTTTGSPAGDALERIIGSALRGDANAALSTARTQCPGCADMFESILATSGRTARERAATAAGEAILFRLGRRLDFLSATATAAPLMGLLGTVLGMIDAFSRLASAGSGVDITTLAGGIWQALLTTAAGLTVAIPALLAHSWFRRQLEKRAFALQSAANSLIDALEDDNG